MTNNDDLIDDVTDDPKNYVIDESFGFEVIAKVYDVTNIAPRVTVPSIWYINLGKKDHRTFSPDILFWYTFDILSHCPLRQ